MKDVISILDPRDGGSVKIIDSTGRAYDEATLAFYAFIKAKGYTVNEGYGAAVDRLAGVNCNEQRR